MLAFVPGLVIMLASIPLGMTHWGSEYVQVNDDTSSTNSGDVLLDGLVAFFVFGPAGAGVIAVASKPRTWRSLRGIGIAEIVMIALTALLILEDNGDYFPLIMAVFTITIFPIVFVGCLLRIGYDALRGRPRRATMR